MTLSPAKIAGGGPKTRWTREAVIEKIREWVDLYGEPPRAADWNPSSAKWSDAMWRVARYRDGDWPSLNAAKRPFGGSLNAAIIAAGFTPNKPGPRRGSAAPAIVREQMTPVERARVAVVEHEGTLLRKRLVRLEGQLATARATVDDLRDQLRTRPRPTTKSSVTTKIERVKVEDTTVTAKLHRRIERLERRLDDREAVLRSEKDRGDAALRDLATQGRAAKRLSDRLAAKAADLADLRADLAESERLRQAAEDRAVAAARIEPVVVTEVREVRSATDAEVDIARRQVERAMREVESAEFRAAKAEREMRDLSATVTGEDRRLTPAEVEDLRAAGPSGPGVLARALKDLAEARKDNTKMWGALTAVASAAIRWRDTLR